MAKKNTEPTVTWTVNGKQVNSANTANASVNNPITFNPYGTTIGKYASYSSGTIPNYNSKYDTKAENVLKKYSKNIKYTDPYKNQISAYTAKVTDDTPYSSKWTDQIQKYLGLMEKDYDPNSDANYIAYKNQYLAGGQKAMQDTLAQAAALTGGYGSSYANSAAQQTYGEYAAALANKIPELAQAAQNMYMQKLGVYQGLDDTDYSRWMDTKNNNYNVLNALMGLSDSAYGRHQDMLGNLYNLYGGYSGLADRDYNRFQQEYAAWQKLQAAAEAAAKKGSGRSGSGGNDTSDSTGKTLIEYMRDNYDNGWSREKNVDYMNKALEAANGQPVFKGAKTTFDANEARQYYLGALDKWENTDKKKYK